jgi:predicted ATP-grasp superfamily ATP-dependent carboligase
MLFLKKAKMQDPESGACRILIIDDNSPFVLPLLRSFSSHHQFSLDALILTSEKPQTYSYSRYLGKLYIASKPESGDHFKVIRDHIKRLQPDMIIPTREWISKLLSQHRTLLEKLTKLHPQPEVSTLEITSDKRNLNGWLKDQGYPYARNSELTKFWNGDYPVLLKPVVGIGGEGIRVFNNGPDLEKAVQPINGNQKEFILQEYIDGYDIDISFFAVNGEILYHTVQSGLISKHMEYSKGIEFIKNQDFYDLAQSIVKTLNYTGIAHLDFRYSSQRKEYVLIDFNARYWSSLQGSRAMGVNFPYLVAQYVMNNQLEKVEYRTGHYYFATTAAMIKVRNLISKRKMPVKFRDTQLHYLYKDPLPELMFIIRKFFDIFKPGKTNRS